MWYVQGRQRVHLVLLCPVRDTVFVSYSQDGTLEDCKLQKKIQKHFYFVGLSKSKTDRLPRPRSTTCVPSLTVSGSWLRDTVFLSYRRGRNSGRRTDWYLGHNYTYHSVPPGQGPVKQKNQISIVFFIVLWVLPIGNGRRFLKNRSKHIFGDLNCD